MILGLSVMNRILSKIFQSIAAFLLCTSWSQTSHAFVDEVWDYVQKSQLGFDYSNSIDRLDLSYEMAEGSYVPASCSVTSDPETKRCSVKMVGGASNGWGVFLQPAFKKQGLFYLDWDVGVGARLLRGQLQESDRELEGLPLRDASFSLAALVVKPYVQFGVTPEGWPDVLVSVGPALQGALGTVAVNSQEEIVAVGTSSLSGPLSLLRGFFALEFVFYRFGDGAFSLVASHDVTGHGQGTNIYPGDIDGMSNFRGSFRRDVGGLAYGFGLKLVTPWP